MQEYYVLYNNRTGCHKIIKILNECDKKKYRLIFYHDENCSDKYDYSENAVNKNESTRFMSDSETSTGKYVKTDGIDWHSSTDQINWVPFVPVSLSCVLIENDDKYAKTIMEC
tara:strand:- start:766 stop:1104 length:339 start_codon:yes stop_codon:yes gene_type:complete